MRLRFVDHSTRCTEGIANNVEVLIGDSRVVADFVVLDTRRNENMPIILGRPFLCTARASIYAGKNSVRFNIGGKIKEFSFETHKPMKVS
jgi:hypothetical protein